MYYLHMIGVTQELVIETRKGKEIVRMSLPVTVYPNPGREALLDIPENKEKWDELYQLALMASVGERKYGK